MQKKTETEVLKPSAKISFISFVSDHFTKSAHQTDQMKEVAQPFIQIRDIQLSILIQNHQNTM